MVTQRIVLVRAPNPSAMTLSGTNSYLVDCGNGEAVCIDPGPAIERHVEALVSRAQAMHCRIVLIVLTHTHPDHAPAAALVQSKTNAAIAASAATEYPHDRDLFDGEVLRVGNAAIDVMDAPGHTFDHLVFYDRTDAALFTGDTVLGEGYVVIAPPNGAMRPYQRTLARLSVLFPDARLILGGHGQPVSDPPEKLREYVQHRIDREAQLLAALRGGDRTIPELVMHIYGQTAPVLRPAAARQMLAYLLALEAEGRVASRAMERALNASEHAILNPEWTTIVGPEHAQTVEEELGAALRLDVLRAYRLCG
ncbi:MAG: MBL fold metallo-hydrolase [Candidatus Baltobacteraceae bacterium]